MDVSRQAMSVVISRSISDRWKERVLLRYSCRLAADAAYVGMLITAWAAFLIAILLMADFVLEQNVGAFASSAQGMALMAFVSISYAYVRSRLG